MTDKAIYVMRGISAYADGTILLVRCPKYLRENYLPNVRTGICSWCGYDSHNDKELQKDIEYAKKRTGSACDVK